MNISTLGFISLTETEPELKQFYNKGYALRFHFIDTYSSISDSEFSVWLAEIWDIKASFYRQKTNIYTT
jgi:hypothetical protein